MQASASSQVMVSKTQPLAESQESAVQASASSQVMVSKTQPVPLSQLSAVQASASLQVRVSKTQPVAGSQLSLVQALASSHATTVVTQAPSSQKSLVHSFPSPQRVSSKLDSQSMPSKSSAQTQALSTRQSVSPSQHEAPRSSKPSSISQLQLSSRPLPQSSLAGDV